MVEQYGEDPSTIPNNVINQEVPLEIPNTTKYGISWSLGA